MSLTNVRDENISTSSADYPRRQSRDVRRLESEGGRSYVDQGRRSALADLRREHEVRTEHNGPSRHDCSDSAQPRT